MNTGLFRYTILYEDAVTGSRAEETVYACCARDAMPKARQKAGLGTARISSWILVGLHGTDGVCKVYREWAQR